MEILYLWTQSFKNLKGGYRLSPKFHIKHKKKSLILNSNKNHISDFYDTENKIQVSSIIGENGSGKSSILKLILKLIYENNISFEHNKDNSYLIFCINEKYYYLGMFDGEIEINGKKEEILKASKNFFTLYFNYMLDSLKDSSTDNWVDRIYHKSDDYTMPLLLEPYKKNNHIDITNIDYLTRQRMILHKQSFKANKFLSEIFDPVKVTIKIDTTKIFKILDSQTQGKYKNAILQSYKNEFKTIKKLFNNKDVTERSFRSVTNQKRMTEQQKRKNTIRLRLAKEQIEDNIKNEIKKLPRHLINNLYIANKIDKTIRRNNDIKLNKFGLNRNTNKISISIEDFSHNTLKLRKALEYHDYILSNNDIKISDNYIKTGGIITCTNDQVTLDIDNPILDCIPNWFTIELKDQSGSTFTSISSGQKSLYILLSTIIYQINNIKSRKDLDSGCYNNILILLDETDLGLHPKWQREYLFNIIDCLKNTANGIKIHLICTSHSPFIVSDLPSDNILFLKNGEESKMTDHDHTFAENIHTLLNDSFFMKDKMMMGKIAENKIKSTFDFLNAIIAPKTRPYTKKKLITRYKTERNDLIKLSSIVGDEYIKKALENSLVEIDNMLEIENDNDKIRLLADALKNNPELFDRWMGDIK